MGKELLKRKLTVYPYLREDAQGVFEFKKTPQHISSIVRDIKVVCSNELEQRRILVFNLNGFSETIGSNVTIPDSRLLRYLKEERHLLVFHNSNIRSANPKCVEYFQGLEYNREYAGDFAKVAGFKLDEVGNVEFLYTESNFVDLVYNYQKE